MCTRMYRYEYRKWNTNLVLLLPSSCTKSDEGVDICVVTFAGSGQFPAVTVISESRRRIAEAVAPPPKTTKVLVCTGELNVTAELPTESFYIIDRSLELGIHYFYLLSYNSSEGLLCNTRMYEHQLPCTSRTCCTIRQYGTTGTAAVALYLGGEARGAWCFFEVPRMNTCCSSSAV